MERKRIFFEEAFYYLNKKYVMGRPERLLCCVGKECLNCKVLYS